MNDRLFILAQRRATLIAKSAQQRSELAQVAVPLKKALELADKGLEAVRYIRRHPVLLAGAFIVTAIWRPKGVIGWIRRGWAMWRMSLEVKRRLAR